MDPERRREWGIVALAWIVTIAVLGYLIANGYWVVLAITVLLMPVYMYNAWRDGKPWWPGGPTRHG